MGDEAPTGNQFHPIAVDARANDAFPLRTHGFRLALLVPLPREIENGAREAYSRAEHALILSKEEENVSQPNAEIWLSTQSEAERLWQGALAASKRAGETVVSLCEAVNLGVRVVELLASRCLEPVRNGFPASIAKLLEAPPPDVDPERDFLHPPKSLEFIDVLDMLSAPELSCISLPLHHGWEDRVASCKRSRARTCSVTDFSVDAQQRKELMLLGAYRNRIFRLPPPLKVIPDEVIAAYPVLVQLVERLFAAAPQ